MEYEIKARGERSTRLAPALGVLPLALVIFLALLMFSPLNTPLIPRDEGVFIYIGRGLLHGLVPYRDLWDHKGPLIYFINALGLWVGRGSLWGIWLVEAVALATSLSLFYRLVRRALGAEAALVALLTWLAGFAIVLGGNVVEEYTIPVAVLSVVIALRPSAASGLWLGALAAFGFWLRPNETAAPLVALGFVTWDALHLARWKGLSRTLLQFAAAFLVLSGVALAYFAARNALPDLFNSLFVFNFLYVSGGAHPLSSLLSGAGYLAVPVLAGLFGAVLGLRARAALSTGQLRLLCIGLALLLVSVPLSLLSGRVYRHYYIPWLLPLSILASYAIYALRHGSPRSALTTRASLALWMFLLLAAIVSIRIRLVPLLAGSLPPEEAQAIGTIQRLPPQGSPLLIWGNETAYAVMAHRDLSGRYVFLAPLFVPGYGERVAGEVLSQISAEHPIILDTSRTDSSIPPLSEAPPQPYLERLYSFIRQNYVITGQVPGKDWVIWSPK